MLSRKIQQDEGTETEQAEWDYFYFKWAQQTASFEQRHGRNMGGHKMSERAASLK